MKTFVLSTIINGRKNFVSNLLSNRADNKKIVNYTIDANNAKSFDSEHAAQMFIHRIVNPHERVFEVDVVEVDETLKQVGELEESDIK